MAAEASSGSGAGVSESDLESEDSALGTSGSHVRVQCIITHPYEYVSDDTRTRVS